MSKKVALLKGGWNSERAVSLTSAEGVYAALIENGYDVLEIDVTRDIPSLIQQVQRFAPDVVCMNALHGRFVEDGMMQGLMEMLGYPYTGSNALVSALAFDKDVSRSLFKAHDLPIPDGRVYEAAVFFGQRTPYFSFPFVAKPLNEGSSVGVFIVHTQDDFLKAGKSWCYGERVLVESYIPGKELSVALMNDTALGILELKPKNGFYDYEAKYTDGMTEHLMPAPMDADEYDALMAIAQRAVRALGVTGISRVDVRYDDQRPKGSRAFILEINTLPGMTPLSIVPEIAAYTGLTYKDLCKWMVENPTWPQEHRLRDQPLLGVPPLHPCRNGDEALPAKSPDSLP